MSKRILVIDDEPLIVDLLTHLLSRFDYQADQASHHQEALEKLSHIPFDAIFLDMRMPDIDGKEFYLQIRKRFPHLAERVVFVTGDIANPETMSFVRETGNLYLEKPFTMRSVKDLLEKYFQTG